ncbi:septum formation initiator family protein [Candidatus Pacearchaeota archaeon]|nr:septum formation initiator family protein [Candidatus Pacearchaeota archaeon]
MNKSKPFVLQLVIVGGFLIFLYIFFALTTSVYRDFQLETNIDKFEDEITRLAEMAQQKPKDVRYFQSEEYKDKYAKESLNLLNPGEKLIIIPQEDQIVKSEVVVERSYHASVLKLPNRNQWWEYFFGKTLSIQVNPEPKNAVPSPEERMQEGNNSEGLPFELNEG